MSFYTFYVTAIILAICGIIFVLIPKIFGLSAWDGLWYYFAYYFAIVCLVLAWVFLGFGVCAQTKQKIQERTEAGEVICMVKTADAVFDEVILPKESYEAFVGGKADLIVFSYKDQTVVVNVSNIEYIKVLKQNEDE